MLNVTTSSVPGVLLEARRLHGAGELARAEGLYLQVLRMHPENAEALLLLGTMALQCRQYAQAAELTRRSIASDPGVVEPYNVLATSLEFLNRFGEAAEVCRRSLALNPRQANIYGCLGSVLLRLRQSGEAAEAFGQAVRLDPRLSEAHYGRACALAEMGDIAGAIEACRLAVALMPEKLNAQELLINLLMKSGELEGARAALGAALAIHPEAAELGFIRAALDADSRVTTAPPSYVRAIFDNHAERFDSLLVDQLQYRAPEELLAAVQAVAPNRAFDVLDLGCGTGLCGPLFRPLAKSLAGIDLSPNMIALARRREVYDHLEAAEIVAFLEQSAAGRYDLLLAADVLIYVGDLGKVFAAATAVLRPGGIFAFSIETTEEAPYVLGHTLRFAHSPAYIRRLAGEWGLVERFSEERSLRLEGKVPVPQQVIVLGKPGNV